MLNTKAKNFIAPSLIALLALMYYPLGMIRALAYNFKVANWSELEGFTWEVIGYFALGAILLKCTKVLDFFKKNPIAAAGSGIFLLVLILQQIFIFPSFYNFGGGLTFLTLILAGMVYGNEFKKIFLPFFWILLLFSLLMDLHDAFTLHASGLTGNWNWSASLVLVTSGSIFFLFEKKLPAFERKWGIIFAVFTVLVLIYLFFSCHFPKGCFLGALAGFGVIAWGYADKFFSKRTRFILLGAALAAGLCIAVWQKDNIGLLLKNDTRLYLWENGFRVFAESPLIGCEYGRYISASADKMSPEYFLTGHASTIHNHPHNEFIYLLGVFGLGGLTIIGTILFVFVKAIRIFEQRKTFFNGYFLFVFTALLVHSFVDVLLMHWPNNIIFYLLCGALLPMMQKETKDDCTEKLPIVNNILCAAAVIFGIYLCYMNFMASMYYRKSVSLGKDLHGRLASVSKSILYRPTYKTVNDLAALSSMLNDDKTAIAVFENMENTTGIKTFSHSNFTLAISYMKCGMPEKALPCFEAEYNAFPLSVRNLYFFSDALKTVGKKDESLAVNQMIDEILKIKGLDRKHLQLLVANPQYDLNSTDEVLKNIKK